MPSSLGAAAVAAATASPFASDPVAARRILLTSVASALPAVPESVADAVVFSAAEAVRVAAEKAAAEKEEGEGENDDGTRPRSADENALLGPLSPSSSSSSSATAPCPSSSSSLPSTPADDVAAALAAPPMLRELEFCAAAGLTDVGLAKMAATLKRRAKSEEASSWGSLGETLSSSSAALLLPRLVSLTIRGAPRVTDAGIITLATALAGDRKNEGKGEQENEGEAESAQARLEELRLPLLPPPFASSSSSFSSSSFFSSRSPLGGLGDFGTHSLARLLPRLRAVDLRGHPRLTPVGVAALAVNARCLRALWLGGGATTQRGSFDSSSLLNSAASDAGVAAAVVGAGETLELLFFEAAAASPASRRQQQRAGGGRNAAASNNAAAATAAAAENASSGSNEQEAAALHAAAANDHGALTAAALGLVAVHAPRIRRLSLRGVEWSRGKTAAAAAVAGSSSAASSSSSSSSSSSFLLLPELEELDVSTPSPSSLASASSFPNAAAGDDGGGTSSGVGAPPLEALSLEKLASLRASGTPLGGPGVSAALRRASSSLRELRVVGCSGFGRELLRALGGGEGGGEEENDDAAGDETGPALLPPPLPLSLLDVRGCESLERATAEDWRAGLGLTKRKRKTKKTKTKGPKTLLRELAVGCRPPTAAEAAAALFFSPADADAILLGDGSLAVSAALKALGRAAEEPSAPLLERLTLRGARLSCADALAVGSLPSLSHLDVSGCVPEVTASMMAMSTVTSEREGERAAEAAAKMTMPELLAEGLRRGALRREGAAAVAAALLLDFGEGLASKPAFRAPLRHLNLSHSGPCCCVEGRGGGGGGHGSGSEGSSNGSNKETSAAAAPPPPVPLSPLALLLAETPRLASLDLSGTGFGDADASALSLCSETLRSLASDGSGCGAGIQRAMNFDGFSSSSAAAAAAATASSSKNNNNSSSSNANSSRYEKAGVGSLSDAGLAALASAAPRLERLSLASGGCRGVGPEGLSAALSRLPHLTHVDLSGAVMSAGASFFFLEESALTEREGEKREKERRKRRRGEREESNKLTFFFLSDP